MVLLRSLTGRVVPRDICASRVMPSSAREGSCREGRDGEVERVEVDGGSKLRGSKGLP